MFIEFFGINRYYYYALCSQIWEVEAKVRSISHSQLELSAILCFAGAYPPTKIANFAIYASFFFKTGRLYLAFGYVHTLFY